MVEANPTTSVVITSYNNARTLGQTVESALAQTAPCEVVIVDDGSSDESLTVLEAFGSRVKVVRQQNAGQPAAVTTGYGASSGEIVIFLDSDDLLYPEAVQSILDAHRSQASTYCWFLELIDSTGTSIGGVYPGEAPETGDLAARVRFRGPEARICPPMSGNAWSRSFLDRAMPLPTDLKAWADSFLIDAAPLYGEVVAIDRRLGAYRLHEQSTSQRSKALTRPNLLRAAQLYRARVDYLARHADGRDVWPLRNWRQQLVLRLLGKLDGRRGVSNGDLVRSALSVDGRAKGAAIALLLLLVSLTPKPVAIALSARLLHLEWM